MRRLMICALATGFAAAAVVIAWAADAATIRLVAEDVTLVVTFADRTTMKITSKPTKINPGDYDVKQFSFYMQDDKKKIWEIRCEERLGTMKSIMVNPGQEKIVDPGPPLTVHTWARQGDPPRNDQVTVDFSLVGKYSETYLPYAFQGKRKPKPPVIIIKDKEGNEMHKDVMSVGGNGQCRCVWKPGAFKGEFTLAFEADMGPFPWSYTPRGKFEVK